MSVNFFIKRPVLSIVISLLILIFGGISIFNLPVEQYPDLTPPTVCVTAQYPGASAAVIAESVSNIIEEKINGVEDMIYMNTTISAETGTSTTLVSFKVGTDPEQAMINVNNRVQMVTVSLPEITRQYGVKVEKRSSSILQVGCLYSTSNLYDSKFLGNYAIINCLDELKRIDGVGDAQVLSGNDYAIRIWPKPDMLNKLNMSVNEIIGAVFSQNQQRAAGKIGQQPIKNVDKSYTIIAQGRYTDPEQFKDIIVRTNPDGSNLKLQDVADVELGAQSYDITSKTNGCQSVPIMFFLSPGANALDCVKQINSKISELSKKFPEGVHYKVIYDTTKFVQDSIYEVVKTLLEAVFLVILVILFFLKRFRATLIPCLAVPVSIIGAFAGMLIFGFSINTLTLFGLVLAIGIVVDDAIIVIENVDRIMKSESLPVYEATKKAIEQVAGPVVAIVLVLCSVFVPVSFIGGLSGVLYKQFAMTIAFSVVISGIVALTLTPALCILLLGESGDKKDWVIFEIFDKYYKKFSDKYLGIVRYVLLNKKVSCSAIAVLLIVTYELFRVSPTSFLPEEDQGVMMGCAFLDPGASLDRSESVGRYLDYVISSEKIIADSLIVAGYDMIGNTRRNNAVTTFMKLKPFEERRKVSESSFAGIKRFMAAGAKNPDAAVIGFLPPPISGLSMTGGFESYVQILGNKSLVELSEKVREILSEASKRPELANLNCTFNTSTPQFKITVDNLKALSMGVSIDELYTSIQSAFGTVYINDFTKSGRTFKVILQSGADYRNFPERIENIYIKSQNGSMIPASELVTLNQVVGCDDITRFNNRMAAKIIGEPAPGYTSGEAMQTMESIFNKVLGIDYGFAWGGASFQEKEASGSGSVAMLLGMLVVFLILAAQYESWSLPIAVLLTIPFAMFGAVLAIWLRGFSSDLYFQVALITLVGLSAKNAILIVEFAVFLRKQGEDLIVAALHAAKLRLRPIVMTSMAFILGSLPLMISSGAGAASRHSIGTSIVGGMIGATFIAPLFIPLFFVLVSMINEKIHNMINRNASNGELVSKNSKSGN